MPFKILTIIFFSFLLRATGNKAHGQIHKEDGSIVVNAPNLFPESIALDPSSGNMYISSIAGKKIAVMDTAGKVQDFITSRQYGFESGLGMKINPKDQTLWAISSASGKKSASVFKFDLRTKKLLKKYTFTSKQGIFLNDLCFDKENNLLITDSANEDIYKINTKTGKKSRFFHSKLITHPNGITYDNQTDCLFVACDFGLVKISPSDYKTELLKMPPNESSSGLDGIYFYQNSIIGIFNDSKNLSEHRVSRFYFNKFQNSIILTETLSVDNLNAPTTGLIYNNKFYFLSKTYLIDFIKNSKTTTMTNEIKIIELSEHSQKKIQIITELTDAFNSGNWDKTFSLYSNDAQYIDQIQGKEPTTLTKEEVRKKYIEFRKNYPDLNDTVENISINGNVASVDMVITGTNINTGEKFRSQAKIILTFNDANLIIKDETIFD